MIPAQCRISNTHSVVHLNGWTDTECEKNIEILLVLAVLRAKGHIFTRRQTARLKLIYL